MDQTTLTYLDAYCERAGDPGIWGEPLNAATNLFFFAAAILGAYALGRAGLRERRIDFWLLLASLAGIAVGSGLWHIAPRGDTVLMDVIPITLFIHIYLVAALRRLFQLTWLQVAMWWLLYTAISVLAQATLPPDTLNGTVMYIPTYLTLVVITVMLWRRDAALGRVFATIVAVWTASLVFRTIDMDICARLPIGTHFLWHSLNAWVLWRLLMALLSRAK